MDWLIQWCSSVVVRIKAGTSLNVLLSSRLCFVFARSFSAALCQFWDLRASLKAPLRGSLTSAFHHDNKQVWRRKRSINLLQRCRLFWCRFYFTWHIRDVSSRLSTPTWTPAWTLTWTPTCDQIQRVLLLRGFHSWNNCYNWVDPKWNTISSNVKLAANRLNVQKHQFV